VSAGAEVVVRDGTPVLLAERDGEYFVERAGTARASMRVEGIPEPLALDEDWSVEFEPHRGAPPRVDLPRLQSWTEDAAPGVRFFSGTGRYRRTFTLPPGWRAAGRRVHLDLGSLWAIGEAWLNGAALGVMWTAPFRVDCTDALREGPNELVVEVTNNWLNRLAGDARLPPSQRITRTNVTTSGGTPWAKLAPLPSGLLGPVRLVAVAQRELQFGGRRIESPSSGHR
jgi:hypothetical protein